MPRILSDATGLSPSVLHAHYYKRYFTFLDATGNSASPPDVRQGFALP
jgi:hypothetical protein